MHRHAHGEVADTAHQRDEIGRVLQIARRQVEILGRVAAQREDVLDPRVVVAHDDLGQLLAGVRGAREVRHGRE